MRRASRHDSETQRTRKSGEGFEYVLCRLCKRAFRAVNWPHLVQKHHWSPEDAVEQYKQRYRLRRTACKETLEKMADATLEAWDRRGGRWTRERLDTAIRTRERRGEPLNVAAVPYGCYCAAKRFYGSWDKALRSLGLDPESCRRNRSWTPRKILCAIRKEAREGRRLNYQAAFERDTGLLFAGIDRFGSWDRALEAAGIDPKGVKPPNWRWSAHQVKEAILDRHKRGLPVNAKAIGSSYVHAAERWFGSWEKAVEACGIPYHRVALRHFWTADTVKATILEMAERGESINREAVWKRKASLVTYAVRIFGSWGNAISACGISYDDVRLTRAWTPELVRARLLERANQGKPLVPRSLQDDDPHLYQKAVEHFGSFKEALSVAGFCAEEVYLRQPWSRERVEALVRERHREGKPLTWSSAHRDCNRLLYAAISHFGTWRAALAACGISDEAAGLRRSWDKERVRKEILGHLARGEPLNTSSVWKRRSILVIQARRLFGSWEKALRACGIPYEKVRLDQRWTEPLVRSRIRERASRPDGLVMQAVRKEELRLHGAATRLFGSWADAVRACGFDASVIYIREKWTDDKVRNAIMARVRTGNPMNWSLVHRDAPKLASAAVRRFGSWSRALAVCGVAARGPEADTRSTGDPSGQQTP